MKTGCHDSIRGVKRLLDSISVMDVNVDVQDPFVVSKTEGQLKQMADRYTELTSTVLVYQGQCLDPGQ